jgi:hypothetical protein
MVVELEKNVHIHQRWALIVMVMAPSVKTSTAIEK